MEGYSGKPLIAKLGLKKTDSVKFFNQPDNYLTTLGLKNIRLSSLVGNAREYDFIQAFVKNRQELESLFPLVKRLLSKKGMLWVSWPKKSSGIESDLNENKIREVGLKMGLVDVKVIAIDDVWSGLKFVYRLSDRK